ncbi:hypothetical protein L6164_008197 [Bauhinia variegata]|uniref:Uncharacterized protein n=1 Tax=Bauhinia variegata TaxID=167791 RepID=A0ACB9PG22_BAUVA|nr:hypothetical protein L6164_008197 [Bauhinia variegata]
MDQKATERSGQNDLKFKCTKILHGIDKQITIQTPEKITESLYTRYKEGQIQLPEKYRTIADLFDHMSCSLRLLNLRKKSTTFQNICTQVEVLAKRKFLYPHLAQMKYILPEAIHIDKILVHDKKSLCMKPDLKITLTFEVVEENSSESAYLSLGKLFGSRLIDFFSKHPEATDVPEAILPEPFSQRTPSFLCEDLLADSSAVLSQTSDENQILSEKLHPYPSFSRHFSQQNIVDMTEKVQCFLSAQTALSYSASDHLCNEESESGWKKGSSSLRLKSDATIDQDIERGQQEESCSMCSQPSFINTPAHQIFPPHSLSCGSSESPNIKVASPTDNLITETPVRLAPRRVISSSDVKVQTVVTQKSTSCYKPAKRVLDFSRLEGDNDALDLWENKLESSRVVHDNICDASRGSSEGCKASGSVVLPQEVEESLGCSHETPNRIQAGLATEQQISSSLIDLVDVIHSVFCSVKYSPITKEELLHKIIMNSLDYVEIREVEERCEILEKVVPDWICKKLVPTGDAMYCIKKVSDLDSVRSKLCSNVAIGVE